MDLFAQAWSYFWDNRAEFGASMVQHVLLSGAALAIALSLCLPLGIWAAYNARTAQLGINLANALRVVPSLAILFLAYPYLGLGFRNALLALTVLACPPLLINTYAGLRAVDPAVVEAARGMGMNAWQRLSRVELPLALPVLLAGVRIATVEVIASAALAAFVGGRGLGLFIQRGFSVNRPEITLAAVVPIALLALLADALLALLQRATQRAA
ncbi:ABC transporter permease [Kallotenue papyrolyticum]|uniref:ABC transporter permease n=1 Tax=Kallotenue papyrolyticum TaxID=1325125 RepID=UPI00047859EE|nr:ABC transporter permease [Kallotenue papyrolyticum]